MGKKITCINCPLGCALEVVVGERGGAFSVRGQECPRGAAYAREETLSPVRILATTVKITGAAIAMLPVRTACPAPRDRLMEIMKALKGVSVEAPVAMGTVIAANVRGTGVDVTASRSVPKAE